MAYLELVHIRAGYEKGIPVLDDFNLKVNKGDLVSILGPSGCGKTTTLRTIVGFIEPEAGQVLIDRRDYTHLPPNRRNIGLVFQSYALFPHMSVYENVNFGLRMRRISRVEARQRIEQALKTVDLEGFERRLPGQLSGGQRQRVALARAIVIQPDLLLLDEPLSNLDAKLRVEMRAELRRLQKQLGITMVYVTHDQAEALSLSDKIIVMNKGHIEQVGSPVEIYHAPATAFVAGFMGFENHFRARVASVVGSTINLEVDGGHLEAQPNYLPELKRGEAVEVFFRPQSAVLSPGPEPNAIPGMIDFFTFQGSNYQYFIRTRVGQLSVFVPGEEPFPQVEQAYVALRPKSLVVAKVTDVESGVLGEQDVQ